MKNRTILAGLIEDIQNGKYTAEECAARYPELANDLYTLIKVASRLNPDDVSPSPEFKEKVKNRLVEEMQTLPMQNYVKIRRWPTLIPTKAVAAIIITFLVIITAGGSTVYAAQRSLPGDTLYPIKTGIENIQLTATPGAGGKARFYLKLIQRRINETTRQVKANRNISNEISETIGQNIDNAIIEANKINNNQDIENILRDLTSSTLEQQLELEEAMTRASSVNKPALTQVLNMTQRGNLIAQVAYTNRQYLTRLPSVLAENAENGKFMIDGTINSIQNQTWNVGGVTLHNVYNPETIPETGKRVVIEGVVKGDEVFISRIETYENSSEFTRMAGRFRGTNNNGTANISGLPVTVNNSSNTWPKPGERIQLQGKTGEEQLNLANYPGETGNDTSSIGQSGILDSINNTGTEITITNSGNQIKVVISEAKIMGERGRFLRLIELRRTLGHHIVLDGLYKKDGRIYARTILVEN